MQPVHELLEVLVQLVQFYEQAIKIKIKFLPVQIEIRGK